MHLDVCNWLCTDRFGLGWAHDAIFFACHMFMHSNAYILYFHYILIYSNCLGLFWLFFSPSLSLSISSVYVSASMAPKSKPTSSRNPLCFEASSSSDPFPFFVQFNDEDAQKDFSGNFSRWGIHSECRVILSDFSDTDLPIVIHIRGWESLCDILITCPSVLIQEFYFNMHGLDTSVPLFHTRIRGTRIMVTQDIVSEVLHVLRVEHPDYPSCERLRTVSNDEMISTFCKRLSD